LAVFGSTVLGLFKLMEFEEVLEKKLGREVDLVTEDSLSPYIRPYVEKEKVIIYEEG
jgi:predicted nucleotidyltransferase